MKEKLQNALGTFGGILYWILTILIAILPLVMIGMPSLVDFIILAVCSFLPFLSIPLWIWGLVEAIKGPQDIFAIIYYIATVAIFLPTIISMISGFIDKRKENKTEQQNNSVNEKEQIKKTSFKLLKGVGIIVGIGVTITLISLIADLMNSDDYKFIGLMLILILVPIILIVIFFAILSKIDRKKEKQKNTNEEKDKYIVKGWKGENLNIYKTTNKSEKPHLEFDENIVNISKFIIELISLNNLYTLTNNQYTICDIALFSQYISNKILLNYSDDTLENDIVYHIADTFHIRLFDIKQNINARKSYFDELFYNTELNNQDKYIVNVTALICNNNYLRNNFSNRLDMIISHYQNTKEFDEIKQQLFEFTNLLITEINNVKSKSDKFKSEQIRIAREENPDICFSLKEGPCFDVI